MELSVSRYHSIRALCSVTLSHLVAYIEHLGQQINSFINEQTEAHCRRDIREHRAE